MVYPWRHVTRSSVPSGSCTTWTDTQIHIQGDGSRFGAEALPPVSLWCLATHTEGPVSPQPGSEQPLGTAGRDEAVSPVRLSPTTN